LEDSEPTLVHEEGSQSPLEESSQENGKYMMYISFEIPNFIERATPLISHGWEVMEVQILPQGGLGC